MNSIISEGIIYVFEKATNELLESDYQSMTIDHVFLGLLQLAELSVIEEQYQNENLEPEIVTVKRFFAQYSIDVVKEFFSLRMKIYNDNNNWYSERLLINIFSNIVQRTKKSEKIIEINDLLEEIVAHPSELILSVLYPQILSFDNLPFEVSRRILESSSPFSILADDNFNTKMVKVKIIEKKRYWYTLEETNGKSYEKNIEFYDTKVEPGDYLIMPQDIINEENMFAFGPLVCRDNILQKDIIKIIFSKHQKKQCLLRYYG